MFKITQIGYCQRHKSGIILQHKKINVSNQAARHHLRFNHKGETPHRRHVETTAPAGRVRKELNCYVYVRERGYAERHSLFCNTQAEMQIRRQVGR